MSPILLTLLTIPLAACALPTKGEETPLHDTYQRYRQTVLDGQIVAKRHDYFTPTVLKEIDLASLREIRSLRLNADIDRTLSHYEKITAERGCLTINGYTREDDPITVFIEYKSNDQGWLINSSFLNLAEKKSFRGFIDHALCPIEAREEIMGWAEKRE